MTKAIDLTGIDKPQHRLTASETALLVFYSVAAKNIPGLYEEFESILQGLEFIPTPNDDTEEVKGHLLGILYTGFDLAAETIRQSYEASKEGSELGQE